MKLPIARIVFGPIRHRYPGLHTFGTAAGKTIHIDPRGRNVGRTLLHEYLHIMHPSWTEARVRAEEKRRWDRLTWRDKAHLYQRLGRATIQGRMEIE